MSLISVVQIFKPRFSVEIGWDVFTFKAGVGFPTKSKEMFPVSWRRRPWGIVQLLLALA